MTDCKSKNCSDVCRERPLSPFLGHYKPQISSVVSILHRVTGIAIFVGSLVFVWWLTAIASGRESFELVSWFFSSWVGYICAFGWTVTFFYHLSNGIRHLIWDMGYGFENETVVKSGIGVLVSTAFFTALTWSIVFF